MNKIMSSNELTILEEFVGNLKLEDIRNIINYLNIDFEPMQTMSSFCDLYILLTSVNYCIKIPRNSMDILSKFIGHLTQENIEEIINKYDMEYASSTIFTILKNLYKYLREELNK